MTIRLKEKPPDKIIPEIINVLAYARVSDPSQVKRESSIPNQIASIEKYCIFKGWKLIRVYTDAGISGGKGRDERPQLRQLMEDVENDECNIVLTTKIDRFARDVTELFDCIKIMDAHHVAFVAPDDNIDTSDTGMGRVILAFLGAIAEWERKRIGERITIGRQGYKARHQFNCGRPPYGYIFDKNSQVWNQTPHKPDDPKPLLIYEPQAEIVRFIFEEFTRPEKRIGTSKMAEILNGKNYLPPKNGRKVVKSPFWTYATALHILRHGAYYGSPNEHYCYAAPALVTKEVWDEAQRRLKTNRHPKPSIVLKSPWQGHLYCGLCGHLLRPNYSHGSRLTWRCKGRNKDLHLDGSPRCTLPNFDLKQIDVMLSKELEDLRTKPGVLKKHLDHSLAEMKSKLTDTEGKTKPLTDQLVRIEKKRKVLDTMVQPEVHRITAEKYREEIVKLNIQEKDLKERVRRIDPNINSDIEFKRQQIDAFQTFIDGIYSNPDPNYHDDLEGTIEVIDRFVKRAKKTLDNHPTKPHPLDAFIRTFTNAESEIGDDVIGIIATGKDGKNPTAEVRFDGKTSKALVDIY